MKKLREKSGLATVETITAIFILSVVGYGCFQLFHVSMNHNRVSQERSLAMRAMKNEWERLKSIPLDQLPREDGRSFSLEMPEIESLMNQSTRIEVKSLDQPMTDAYSIVLHVSWTGFTSRPMSETLETIRAF
jgi:hypothetical protein